MLLTWSLPCPEMSVNWPSTIFDLALWIIQPQRNSGNPQSTHRQPRLARMLVTIWRLPPTIERPQSIHSCCGGSECHTAMKCIVLFLNRVLCGQSLQSNHVYNFINMQAMSFWAHWFTCSSRVNIWEPAVCFAVLLLSAVFQIGLPSFLIPTAMSDSKSLNTSLLKVIISSKNERVFICDLSDLTSQIIFDDWWTSMNIDSQQPIAWNNSSHAPSWQFYSHCGIEETGSPGIICIICHQVLCNASEHGTSSMGKHLLAKAHIAKLNELTESEVTELTSSKVDETALAILKRQGSRGITLVSWKLLQSQYHTSLGLQVLRVSPP